jgi:Fe-S oxidoreductase
VGIDPAVTLTYRAEYVGALGQDAVPEVSLLQEWLAKDVAEVPRAARGGAYRLMGHCTERTNAPSSSRQWQVAFERFGLALRIDGVGCCGMAGTYGHVKENRPASEALYEQSWGPHVAAAEAAREPPVATGYSCRSQAKLVGRTAIAHPVQVLLRALRQGS